MTINVDELNQKCEDFRTQEGRASFYDMAIDIVDKYPLQACVIILATWNVSREFSLQRTIVGTKNVLVPHFQETFTVNDFGTERTYFIHTIQNPFTNEVVYIEGWSSVYDAPRAENILRAVSRTIRFE